MSSRRKNVEKLSIPTKGKTRVISLYSVLHAYTLLFMMSNHTQLKHFSCTDFICTGDSLRFALLPQYTEPIEPFSIHLSKSFLSQPVAKRGVCVRKPNFFCLDCMAAEGRSSAEGNCWSGIKLNVIHFIINQIFKQTGERVFLLSFCHCL